MANRKIWEFPENTNPIGGNEFVIDNNHVTQKISLSGLTNYVVNNIPLITGGTYSGGTLTLTKQNGGSDIIINNLPTIGIIAVPVTTVITSTPGGTTYLGRYGTINQRLGTAGNFTITPGSTTTPDSITTSKTILRVSIIWYLQTITQTGQQRVFATLNAGISGVEGGAQTADSVNNSRMNISVQMCGVQPNSIITNSLDWIGIGPLTNNGSRMYIEYLE